MYLHIALAINLAAATGFALLAIRRGRDYNGLLEKYTDMSDICSAWQKNSNKLNRKLNDKEAYIKQLETENNRLKQSGIKSGIIQQSCGSVDCDGKPNHCKECNQHLFQKRNTCK